jgi:hypothetical protein
MPWRERVAIGWTWLRCWLRGTHAPVLGITDDELFVRCRSCGLRSDGIQVPRATPLERIAPPQAWPRIVRKRIDLP